MVDGVPVQIVMWLSLVASINLTIYYFTGRTWNCARKATPPGINECLPDFCPTAVGRTLPMKFEEFFNQGHTSSAWKIGKNVRSFLSIYPLFYSWRPLVIITCSTSILTVFIINAIKFSTNYTIRVLFKTKTTSIHRFISIRSQKKKEIFFKKYPKIDEEYAFNR